MEGGLASGDFTLEAWVYHDALGNQTWFSQYNGNTGFDAGIDGDGDFFWIRNSTRLIDAASQISANTWYHVAFVRHNGILQGFLNGVQKGSDYNEIVAVGGSGINYSAKEFAIGARYGPSPGAMMDGHIEDFRISKGFARYPLTPEKQTLTTSTALQSGNTCTASNVKLLALTTSTVTQDISSQNHTITNVNSVTASNYGPVSGMKSALFDASDDERLSIADGAWKTWGANFTIECWAYAKSFPQTSNNYICGDFAANGAAGSASISLKITNAGSAVVYSNVGGAVTPITSVNFMDLLKWYHLALVRSSGSFQFFVNGKKITENATMTGTIADNSNIFAIGAAGAPSSQSWDGYISNFRVNNGQVLYTNTFTPPTTHLTA